MIDHDQICMETTCTKPVKFRIFEQVRFGLCEEHCSEAFKELTEHLGGRVVITYTANTQHPGFTEPTQSVNFDEDEDIAYFRKKLREGLKIPKEYIEEGLPPVGDDEYPETPAPVTFPPSEESRQMMESVLGEELGN